MRISPGWILVAVLVSLSFCSCQRDPRVKREVFPVKGRVTVDGVPTQHIRIAAQAKDKSADNPDYPVALMASTKEDGTFAMTSYDEGDGMPSGEYTMTFAWREPKGLIGLAPDKLEGRYSDPAKSKFTATVGSAPVDLGTIELTSK